MATTTGGRRVAVIRDGGGSSSSSSCPIDQKKPGALIILYADADLTTPTGDDGASVWTKRREQKYHAQLGPTKETVEMFKLLRDGEAFFKKVLGLDEGFKFESDPSGLYRYANITINIYELNPDIHLRPIEASIPGALAVTSVEHCDKATERGLILRVNKGGFPIPPNTLLNMSDEFKLVPEDTMIFYGTLTLQFADTNEVPYNIHFETSKITAQECSVYEVYHPRLGLGTLRGTSFQTKNENDSTLDTHIAIHQVMAFPGIQHSRRAVRTMKEIIEEHVDYTIRAVIAIKDGNDDAASAAVQVLMKNAREWARLYRSLLGVRDDFYPLLWEHTVAAKDLAVAINSGDEAEKQRNLDILIKVNLPKVVEFHARLGYPAEVVKKGWMTHLTTTVDYYNALWDRKMGGSESKMFSDAALVAVKHGQAVGAALNGVTKTLIRQASQQPQRGAVTVRRSGFAPQ